MIFKEDLEKIFGKRPFSAEEELSENGAVEADRTAADMDEDVASQEV